MSVLWQPSEDAYLATHYATATIEEMMRATGRTLHAIHYRAKLLKLYRANLGRFKTGERPSGKMFKPGNKPWNAGTGKVPLRKKVIEEFARHQERTITQLAKTTGSTKSGCWKTCDALRQQKQLHIVRYQQVASAANNFEAVYRIGRGVDAIKPIIKGPRLVTDPYETQPIPRPVLGAWGCVWNTTNPAHCAGERN